MNIYKNNLTDEEDSSSYSESEFYTKYLLNSSFRGFYYDTNDRSYGISLQFLSTGYSTLNLYAVESKGSLSVIEYRISSKAFAMEAVAYDKVLIVAEEFQVESILPESLIIQMPKKLEFTLQLLTRNSLFIRFLDSEKYTSPIKSFKGGLVLAREMTLVSDKKLEEAFNYGSFFQV